MEIREAKAELQEYIHNKNYLERKQEEILRLEERINKVTATYSDMPKGGSGNSKEDLIAMKLDLEKEVYGYLMRLLEKEMIIERTLQKLDPIHRNILDFLYIEEVDKNDDTKKENTLVDYAAKNRHSYRQATRLLKKAYKQYSEMREEP